MPTPLQEFRDDYLEMLLRFLWREWTALGVAGQERIALRHVVDPEALLLFSCTLGRYDQRLFDEMLDWLTKNGRFLNVQRMKNILKKEEFGGRKVLAAIADWLCQQRAPMKWNLLAKYGDQTGRPEPLFYLSDRRPLPQTTEQDAVFAQHGFARSPIKPRGYAQTFPPGGAPSLALRMRALFGLNARCDVFTYLALNGTGHPRQVARELYYSQKAIHDAMTDMACSGVVHSSRAARERTFRIAPHAAPSLTGKLDVSGWINWPVLLSSAETVWRLTEELSQAHLDTLVESSEVALTVSPLLDRLARAPWIAVIPNDNPRQGIGLLRTFMETFEAPSA